VAWFRVEAAFEVLARDVQHDPASAGDFLGARGILGEGGPHAMPCEPTRQVKTHPSRLAERDDYAAPRRAEAPIWLMTIGMPSGTSISRRDPAIPGPASNSRQASVA